MKTILKIVFFIFLIAYATYAQAQDPTRAKEALDAAQQAYNRQDYTTAFRQIQIAEQNAPNSPKVLRLKQQILDAQKQETKPDQTRQPYEPEMVKVIGGIFQMGSNDYDSEKPIHSVKVSDFYIGKYEVTQKQWREVMGNNPPELNNKNCDKCPVERVSWDDVQEFLKKLNQKTGKTYRLPTEEEWEYATRGGNKSAGYKYAGSNDIGRVAWYGVNYKESKYGTQGTTHPVGTKSPNELDIYDMSGNVWEWTSSGWSDSYKKPRNSQYYVLRGGSWDSYAINCRVANRSIFVPTGRNNELGFRLAQDF
jgi:formylglycine-generating enzyme required for sulfatase activity